MKSNDNVITRRMSLILWFFVVAVPFYLLGLQFHFSAKGALLSSAVAAAFGGLASLTAKKNTIWRTSLTLLSPFVFIFSILLMCPLPATLLYALSLSLLFIVLSTTRDNAENLVTGGRGEFLILLQSAAVSHLVKKYSELFRAWSIGALVSFILFSFMPSELIAFVPLAAIAVVLSSVLSSSSGKELK